MRSAGLMTNGAEGDRTLNLRIANATLSQLSYRPSRVGSSKVTANPPKRKSSTKANRARIGGIGAMSCRFHVVPALVLIVVLGEPTRTRGADDAGAFPRELVTWTPVAANPVFQGTGGDAWDRKIRERGYILVEGGTYHLWYTGYNDDRSSTKFLGHATSADGLRWVRDPANPIFSQSWVEDVCVVRRDGMFVMVAEGKGDIAHQLTSPDGLHWDDLGSLDVRNTQGAPISPGPYGTPTA